MTTTTLQLQDLLETLQSQKISNEEFRLLIKILKGEK